MLIVAVTESNLLDGCDFMDVNNLTERYRLRFSQHSQYNHVCPRCNKAYKWRHNMIQHMKRDCGKPPNFRCPYCEYCSKQKNNLIRHVLSKHKEFTDEFLNDVYKGRAGDKIFNSP